MTLSLINDYFSYHDEISKKLDSESINFATKLIINKFKQGNAVYTCGNGGSAHTASHYITDWVKMGTSIAGLSLKGFSLCDNVGMITAYGNDFNYDEIFAGQLRSSLRKDDLVIAISGSGNSKNVLNAINYANQNEADTLAIVGFDGGKLKKIAKYNFHVPCFDMQICEDIHLKFGHIVMKAICNIGIER